jgi:vanillate O-demethylase ferredoxin subunit
MRAESTWTDAVVRATRDVAPNIRQIEFAPERGQVVWTAGSHIDIGVMVDGRADTRSYSLVGEPDAGCYRVAVKREEQSRGGSRFMWSLKPGSRLSVSAPKNLFELQVGRPEYLLVAGGIGITPIVGMAQVLARRGEKFRLYYCGRSRREMAFLLELFERLGDRLEIFAADEGHRLNIAEAIAGLARDTELYLCGPMRLLDAARQAWAGAGRPATSLRYETFANSGRHAPERFWVRVPSHGVEIVVPENKTMLDALNEAGVEVMWDCLRGECGLCAVDIVEVDGGIDHRDVFLSDHQKQENTKLCTCVSRAFGGGVVIDTGYRPG